MRSARPGGLTQAEANYLVGIGDAQCGDGPIPIQSELSAERIELLWLKSRTTHRSHRAGERLARIVSKIGGLNDDDRARPNNPLQQGLLTGGIGYLALAHPTVPKQDLAATILDDVRVWREKTGLGGETRTLLKDLSAPEVNRRYRSRLILSNIQPDRPSLNLLADLRPRVASDCLDIASQGDVDMLARMVRLDLALANGFGGTTSGLPPNRTYLIIGGRAPDFAFGIISPDKKATWVKSISESLLFGSWSAVRKRLGGPAVELLSELTAYTEILGLDSCSSCFNDRDIILLVVPPFDNLMLDLAVRSISSPRSVTYCVLGGRSGVWQSSLRGLSMTGGRRIFVSDPTRSLSFARIEAGLLSSINGGEVVSGFGVDRSRIMRSLEVRHGRPQFLHFSGHGVSGLADADGMIVSGVVAAEGEVITVSMLAESVVPRVLIASACDVACLPPVSQSRGWHRAAIAAGAGYSVAASVPVSDVGAFVFSTLLHLAWRDADNLRLAFEATLAGGKAPVDLRAKLIGILPAGQVRDACVGWVENSSAADIALLFHSFSIARA